MKKFQPGIVGVTGSVGKTSTKQAIFTVLRNERRVRVSKGSLNNEFGFPLTILGDWSDEDLLLVSKQTPPGVHRGRKMLFWLKVVVKSVVRLLLYSRATYPEILVLEYGADRPGDIQYLIKIAKPQISVVTAVGDIPVHVEFFRDTDAVLREKARLVQALSKSGVAVLNADEDRVRNLERVVHGHVVTFGFSETAGVRISQFEHRIERRHVRGIQFKLEHGGSFVPVRIDGVIGKGYAHAAAAAAAVGLTFGVNLVKIANSLQYFEAPGHRLRILPGIKNSYLIDDSYNASPASMHLALDALQSLKAMRKVAILGDMLELGKYTVTAHEDVGRKAGKTLDILITVGGRAKFIAKTANKAGMPKKRILSFDTAEEALESAQKLVKKGDMVLVKASRAVGLDAVATALLKK